MRPQGIPLSSPKIGTSIAYFVSTWPLRKELISRGRYFPPSRSSGEESMQNWSTGQLDPLLSPVAEVQSTAALYANQERS